MTSPPLLALDTATPTARVALLDAAGARLAGGEKTAARHSENVLRLVDETLRAGGVGLADLAAIACGAGPGSFTGLRVGLAVAKGLALPTDLPLLLVSSLEALATDLLPFAPAGALLLPCIDAGKEQVYARPFRAEAGRAAPLDADDVDWAIGPEALCERAVGLAAGAPVLAAGNGVDRYLALFGARLGEAAVRAALPGPSAEAVGRLAWARLSRGERDDLATAVPVYGRPPDITKPKRPPPR
jgi:tRNA threonylcarbamoyladenosine biosynthesis protein TsaB